MSAPVFARAWPAAMAALLLTAAAPPAWAFTPPQILHLSAERRVEVHLGGDDTARAVVVAPAQAVTLHRVRVECLDASGRPQPLTARWRIVLSPSDSSTEAVARLSTEYPDLAFPRPFGLRWSASDSLLVLATVDGGAPAPGTFLRITFEYEADEATRSWLPVRIVAPAGAARVWNLRAAVDGRLVALAGPAMACADTIVVEDAASGAVLWRMRTTAGVPSVVSAQRSAVARPGVVLERGRHYLVRAESANGAPTPCAGEALTVLLLPHRRD